MSLQTNCTIATFTVWHFSASCIYCPNQPNSTKHTIYNAASIIKSPCNMGYNRVNHTYTALNLVLSSKHQAHHDEHTSSIQCKAVNEIMQAI
jgi:hypothetical protein